MNYRYLVLIAVSLMLTLVSCGKRAEGSSDGGQISEDSVEALLEKSIEDRVNADPQLAELREAAVKMSGYLRLDGDRYVLDLTEEEAVKLGISPENYQRQVDELNETNKKIAELKAQGDTIDLIDIQKVIDEQKAKAGAKK